MNWNKMNIEGISVKVKGHGPSLVCISGFGCSDWNYDLLKNLLSSSFQVVLINNRGMGESAPSEGEFDLKDLARDVLKVMDALSISKFHVMGVSMGGFIASELTLMAPHRVLSLILGCSLSGGEDFPKLQKITEEAILKGREFPDEMRESAVLNATVHPDFFSTDLFNHILKLRLANIPNVDAVLKQVRAVDLFLAREQNLHEIEKPVLILTGDSDRFVPPVASEILHKKIPNSQLIYIERADHHFFLERAGKVASIVNQFILGEKDDYQHLT